MLRWGCFYWNANFRVVCDFGIMNVASHKDWSVSLYPPLCLYSLREGGGEEGERGGRMTQQFKNL